MNVLSLFDGMSCGQIALERAGIKVDNYFASEIDKYAITITMKNYPDTVQVGSVLDLHGEDLPKIDLLTGGSPCQGFSTVGKQLNFNDERSKLFFEFVRLKNELNPKYFLLENVVMKKEYSNIISDLLGIQPIKINSSLVSAQNRNRLYWTNIPIGQIEDKNILWADIRNPLPSDKYWTESRVNKFNNKEFKYEQMYIDCRYLDKIPCLMAQMGGNRYKEHTENGIRILNPLEWERLQTVPEFYTEGVSTLQRYKMLGNGWTVDIIKEIFKGLINDYTINRRQRPSL